MRKTNNIWTSGEFSVHYSDLAPMICQVLFMLLLIIVFFFLCREWLCYWHIRIVQSWLIQQWTLPHPWASVVWIRLQLQFGWWGRTYWSLWLYILRNESTSQLCQNEQEKKAVLFLLAVDTDIRGAAQSVTVTRLSDSTCGWGCEWVAVFCVKCVCHVKQFSGSYKSWMGKKKNKCPSACLGSITNNLVNYFSLHLNFEGQHFITVASRIPAFIN